MRGVGYSPDFKALLMGANSSWAVLRRCSRGPAIPIRLQRRSQAESSGRSSGSVSSVAARCGSLASWVSATGPFSDCWSSTT